MKKRLRKKKHVQEFAERGRQVIITRTRKDSFDEFLNAFIVEAIERNYCFCGGSGKEDRLDVIVELGTARDDREKRIRGIRAWLDGRSDVAGHEVGPEFNLWHEDCPGLSRAARGAGGPG